MQLTKQKDVMKSKLPEITKALDILEIFLLEKENDYKVSLLIQIDY